jgi:tetratricopeptide (TPR) repeat protein
MDVLSRNRDLHLNESNSPPNFPYIPKNPMRRKLNVKLVASVLAGLLVASVGVHFLHGYQLQRNAYRLLEQGDRAADDKDDEKALTYYGQYLSFVPNDADTVQKYAQVLDRRAVRGADRVQLILRMEQVLRVKPNEHEFRFRLVHNLIALRRFADAIDNLKKLESNWRDKAEVLHMLGLCQEAQKEYPQAVASFEEAIRINPKQVHSYTLLAEVLQDRLNQPDEAQKAMDDLVRANADSHQAYLLRARFQRRRGDEKKAESDLGMAYKLGPDQPDVILEVADAARASGNWKEAVGLLKDGMKRFPDQAAFYKGMAWVKILTDHRDEAIGHLEDGLRHAPKSNELAILLIDLLIDQQHYKEARAKIDDLLKAGLKPTLPNYLKARLAVAHQEWNEAIKLLESARQDLGAGSEWNSRVNALLGLCHRQLGDHEQELQAFRRAVQDEPTWITANVGLGLALLNNGRLEEGSQTLEPLRTMKDLPAGYWILLSRTRLYQQMRLPEAERRWNAIEETLAKADPKSVEALSVRAEMLAARRDFAGAKTMLEKSKAEHPADVTLWCALADLAARQHRFDDAEKILEQAAADKAVGDRVELRLAKCRLWGQRGTPDDRAKLTRLADVRDTTYSVEQRARLWRELADTWYRLGHWQQADQLWREVARVLPKDLRSRTALLEVALQQNQTRSARLWRDEIRAIEGEQGWLWRYGDAAILVQEAHGRRSQLDEARKRLKELEAVHKNGARVALLSATISELEGKNQQAIQEYIRALELGQTQPRVLASLLSLLLQRREFGKAETELAKYEEKLPLTKDLARLGAEVAVGMRDKQYARLAIKRAEQAVTLPARDYRDALWLARIYQAAGETAKAEALLRDSLDQAGHTPDTWIAWMEHLQQTHQRGQAVKDLERMKKVLPTSRQPLTMARCYEALQMPEQAARAYQDALRQVSDDFILLAYAADFARRADHADEAQKLYERLLDPDVAAPAEYTVPARRHLAVLLAQRDSKKARALLDENKASRGDTIADQRIRLFIRSLTPSARQDALNKFEESLRFQVVTADERLLLARMLESADRLGQARAQLAELTDEYPAVPQYLVLHARILIRMSDLDEAERQVARLETLEPNSERVRELRTALSRGK